MNFNSLSLWVKHDTRNGIVPRFDCYNECLSFVRVSCNNLEEVPESLTVVEGCLADNKIVGVEGVRL